MRFYSANRNIDRSIPFLRAVFSLIVGGVILWIAIATPAFSQLSQAQSFASAPVDYQYIEWLNNAPLTPRLPQQVVANANSNITLAPQYYGTGAIRSTHNKQAVSGYNVYLQANPTACREALSCTIAYANADVIDTQSPPIEGQYRILFDQDILNRYRRHAHFPYQATLSNGIIVWLLPWVDGGAGAGWEQAVWDEWTPDRSGGIRYTIGLKWGDPDALIQMVESAFKGESAGWDSLIEPADSSR